jgi:hypothetical protein
MFPFIATAIAGRGVGASLQKPRRQLQRCVKPRNERIASVFDIKFEAFCEKHRRAAGRRAVRLRKTQSRSPKEEDAAGSAFGLARYPKSAFIAANKK